MGNYTRIKFASVLRSDTPSEVVEVLSAVSAGDWSRAKAIAPLHEFFEAERWAGLLRGNAAAPVWPQADGRLTIVCSEDGLFSLAFHSSTKNYDNEIDKFLAWTGPYLASAPGDVLGEFEGEDHYRPTLLIAQNGRIDKHCVRTEVESDSHWGYG